MTKGTPAMKKTIMLLKKMGLGRVKKAEVDEPCGEPPRVGRAGVQKPTVRDGSLRPVIKSRNSCRAAMFDRFN